MSEAKKWYQLAYGKELEMYTRTFERSFSGRASLAARSLSAQISVIGPWRGLNS